jgi:hypothetical protein
MMQNMGTQDRIIRVVAGFFLIAAAILEWVGQWGWVGLYPLLTGTYGICLEYMPFRFNTFRIYAHTEDVFEEKHR